MVMTRLMGDLSTVVARWIARMLGLLASVPFVLFLVFLGATICPRLSWSNPRGMPLLCVLSAATVGVLIAWRWEMIGGAMAVVAAVAISGLVYFGSARTVFPAAMMASVPYFVAGVLFLACCWRTRRAQSRRDA
jgi:anti-sigma-K factor RskA